MTLADFLEVLQESGINLHEYQMLHFAHWSQLPKVQFDDSAEKIYRSAILRANFISVNDDGTEYLDPLKVAAFKAKIPAKLKKNNFDKKIGAILSPIN